MPHDASPAPPPAQEEFSLAGSVIDKAIEYMAGQNIGDIAMATALLGGAMAMLSRAMTDGEIVNVLTGAIESVRSGQFREQTESRDS
jgi:hypothetical protein